MADINKEFVLGHRPAGTKDLKETWKLQNTPYPKIQTKGEFIYKNLFISVDPYMSSQLNDDALGGNPNKLGDVQKGHAVARVVESQNDTFPVGTMFFGVLPWRKYGLSKGSDIAHLKIFRKPGDPETVFDRLGYSYGITGFGMPAQTAYYGSIHVGKFTKNDILVVSGAAGAVGSLVGQIAKKIQGVKKVIGIAGGEEKCKYLLELGFDQAVDYKVYNTQEKMVARLKELAGEPITTYFDNTGGFVTDAIFDIIAKNGRVIICGQISSYHKGINPKEDYAYPNYLAKTIYRSITISGFIVYDFFDKNEKEFFVDFPNWVEKGIIKVHETKLEGFEKLPEAYELLYTGGNIGKIVVEVSAAIPAK